MNMKNNICPNCGASLDRNGVCQYCGNGENGHDYSQQLSATRIKHEIRELQREIDKELKEITKLLNDNSPNGCLIIGIGITIVVIVICAIMVAIFRGGDGIGYVGLVSVIVLPIVYVICKSCDNSGNEDAQKKIKEHQRNIKKLTKEIEDIQNGVS